MSSIYRKLEALKTLREFNPALALAPKTSMGNREPSFSDRAEEAIRIAVEDAWRDPKGTWKTVRARLEDMTGKGENTPTSPILFARSMVLNPCCQGAPCSAGFARSIASHEICFVTDPTTPSAITRNASAKFVHRARSMS